MAVLLLLLIPFALAGDSYVTEESGLHAALMIGGAKADNPQVGFYGTTLSPVPPAVIFDADLGGVRGAAEISFGKCMPFTYFPFVTFSLSSSLFWGEWNTSKRAGTPEDIDLLALFAIDGSGEGVLLPLTQTARCQTEEWISDSAFMGRFLLQECGPFRFVFALGPALFYRSMEHCSTLRDYVSGDGNGAICERVSSLFVGGRVGFELEVRPSPVVIQLIPEVTFYGGWHRFHGTMDFGVNELPSVSLLEQTQHGAYDAKIRALISTDAWCGRAGVEFFAHFISYAPGIFNPRSEEDQAAHLTNQNSTLWGGGFFFIF